jgi:hypothetical protein
MNYAEYDGKLFKGHLARKIQERIEPHRGVPEMSSMLFSTGKNQYPNDKFWAKGLQLGNTNFAIPDCNSQYQIASHYHHEQR